MLHTFLKKILAQTFQLQQSNVNHRQNHVAPLFKFQDHKSKINKMLLTYTNPITQVDKKSVSIN